MRIVGRDHIFKILNEEYYESVFNIRKKYFLSRKPKEIGKGSNVYFIIKNKKDGNYYIVGEGKVSNLRPVQEGEKDYEFAFEHNWKFVTEFEELRKFNKQILARDIFSEIIYQKLKLQSPSGIEIPPEEANKVRERIKKEII
ncbi:MAG: hypothetical protein QXX95_01780 [Nitrososphaerales archaeon]